MENSCRTVRHSVTDASCSALPAAFLTSEHDHPVDIDARRTCYEEMEKAMNSLLARLFHASILAGAIPLSLAAATVAATPAAAATVGPRAESVVVQRSGGF